MVALKAFFMNEVSNLKNEIERLKQTAYNQKNNVNMENHSTVNVNYHISLLQRENAVIKTELNNKQNIIEKLNFDCSQSSLNISKIDVNKNDRMNERNFKGNPLKYNKDKNSNGNPIIMEDQIHVKETHLKRK